MSLIETVKHEFNFQNDSDLIKKAYTSLLNSNSKKETKEIMLARLNLVAKPIYRGGLTGLVAGSLAGLAADDMVSGAFIGTYLGMGFDMVNLYGKLFYNTISSKKF